MILKIKHVYDITSAIISNNFIAIQNISTPKKTGYRIETYNALFGNLTLQIDAPHGAPEWNIADEFWIIREGVIQLYQNKDFIFAAYTKHNVGRAFGRSKHNPICILTRIQSPRFFKLLNMADACFRGQLEAHDNNLQIYHELKKLKEKQK